MLPGHRKVTPGQSITRQGLGHGLWVQGNPCLKPVSIFRETEFTWRHRVHFETLSSLGDSGFTQRHWVDLDTLGLLGDIEFNGRHWIKFTWSLWDTIVNWETFCILGESGPTCTHWFYLGKFHILSHLLALCLLVDTETTWRRWAHLKALGCLALSGIWLGKFPSSKIDSKIFFFRLSSIHYYS